MAVTGKDKKLVPEMDIGDVLNLEEGEEEKGFKIVEAARVERKMPPFPNKIIKDKDSDQFFAWVDSLTEEDFSHLSFYLYRHWPYIDRKKMNPNNNNFIDKFMSGPITKDMIIKSHGSGEYRIIVSDSNKMREGKHTIGGQIGEAYFSFNNLDIPPILVYDELIVEHPKNRSYVDGLMARGILNRDGKEINKMTQGANDNERLIGLLSELVRGKMNEKPVSSRDTGSEMQLEAMKAALDVVKQQSKGDDPEKLVKLLAGLQQMLAGNKPEGMLELIVKMQADSSKLQLEAANAREAMMMKMMEMVKEVASAKKEEGDPFDKELERVIKIKELFGDGDSGGRGGGKRSNLEVILETSMPILGKVLDGVMQFMTLQNYAKGVAMQNGAKAATPEIVNQVPRVEGVGEVKSEEVPQLRQLLLGPAGPMIIAALDRRQSGDEFAEGIVLMLGNNTFDKIQTGLKEMGVDGFVEGAKKEAPEFWNQVGSETSLRRFMEEFIGYEIEEEEGVSE